MSNNDQIVANFYQLSPHMVMNSIDQAGFETTGRYQQLNSYENRVFSIETESSGKVETIISKFYRPGRWSKAAVMEEHQFLKDLYTQGIPVVAPLEQNNQSTLSQHYGMFLALFPKAQGRQPQEFTDKDYESIGRLLARIHNVGSKSVSINRPTISVEEYGVESMKHLWDFIPQELKQRYIDITDRLFLYLEHHLKPNKFIRIHGDCHKGNILETNPREGSKEFFFIDFDDFCMGPVAQDFWMLLSGDGEQAQRELRLLTKGYQDLRQLDSRDLVMIPGLQALRIVYYAGWIARRWTDPSFPNLFPQFTDHLYWMKEIEALERIVWTLKE